MLSQRVIVAGILVPALTVILVGSTPVSAQVGAEVISAYTLAAPVSEVPSGLVARVVIPAGLRCPTMQVADSEGNLRNVAMRERHRPANTGSAFAPLTVCSSPVPAGVVTASIAGREIPAAMPGSVTRMAMLGDSGCRVTTWEVQDCSDPTQWPLARISAAVAADDPDVIVINGDFFYRESTCPVNLEPYCAASPGQVPGLPFTDSAYAWLADVFIPMAPMLSAAPLVTTRGNHEACNRGGNGYFYFFDPRQDTASTCAPILVDGVLTAAETVPSPTYPIDLQVSPLRTLRLAVADSSGGNDSAVSPYSIIQRPAYERAAALTAKQPGRESWLLTHRPIFGFASSVFGTPSQPIVWGSADQAAAAWGLLGTYNLIFSSHMHIAEVVQLPGLPAQLILGNAGTELDPSTGYALPNEGFTVGPDRTYPVPTSAWVDVRFGYVMAEPGDAPNTWRLQMRDPQGATFATCRLRTTRLYCR